VGSTAAQRVAAVRDFNRFYTSRIGVLNEGYLSSRYSLTEVRVLYELAHRGSTTATELRRELGERGTDLPVFIGGKLNRIPDGTNTSLPVDISKEIAAAGAIVCTAVDGMIAQLLQIAQKRPQVVL